VTRALPTPAEVIPHTGSCVLLDALLSADEHHLAARARITPTPYSAPDGSLPGWAGVEIMAQAVSAYAGCKALDAGEPIRPGLLLGTRGYRCAEPVLAAGRQFEVMVRASTIDAEGLGVFDCELTADGALFASGTLTVFQPEDATRFVEEQGA
jgi:predicted hotdog family 3-hydroxylacyl-ACP dehydratase